jgi:hypothetical protein
VWYRKGEADMKMKKGILRSFNVVDYKATIQLADNFNIYLEDITVARNLPVAVIVNGRKTTVIFFKEHNLKEQW